MIEIHINTRGCKKPLRPEDLKTFAAVAALLKAAYERELAKQRRPKLERKRAKGDGNAPKCIRCQGKGKVHPGFAYSSWEQCADCRGARRRNDHRR